MQFVQTEKDKPSGKHLEEEGVKLFPRMNMLENGKIAFQPIDWGNVIVDDDEEEDGNHDEDMTHHCVDLSLLCPPCLHSAFVPLTPRRCRRSVYSFKRTFAHSLRHNCISAGWVA